MKRFLLMTLICVMLISSLSAFAVAENITINGTTLTIPEGMGTVCEKDDRTFVPVRFVVEYLNCVINYQELQQSVTITNTASGKAFFLMANDDKLVTFFEDSAVVTVMDTKVFINDDEGRMYVPVRFLAEALGYTVDWDETTQTVSLVSAQ